MLLVLWAAGLALAPAVAETPRIVVEGNGSVAVPPNVANLSFNVLGEGKTSDAAV